MKVVMLMDTAGRERIFAQQDIERMQQRFAVDLGGEKPTPESARERIQGADIVVTTWGSPMLSAEVLGSARVGLLAHAAGSVKPVVSDALYDAGARVSSAACVLGRGVAETTLGLTIMALKNLPNLSRYMAQGGWQEQNRDVRELYRVTIGIISAGHVGRWYAKLLRMFDVEVLLYDPYVSEEEARALNTRKVSLEELLRQSDVVSVHAPSIEATRHMIDAQALAMMKKDAILINTARGSIVDEKALYDHMAAGNLRYACLDVYDPEPPAADHPLRSLPNAILTPHIAGLVTNGLYRIGGHVVGEMIAFEEGRPLAGEVTREMLATMA